jgi:hypothetical protein
MPSAVRECEVETFAGVDEALPGSLVLAFAST